MSDDFTHSHSQISSKKYKPLIDPLEKFVNIKGQKKTEEKKRIEVDDTDEDRTRYYYDKDEDRTRYYFDNKDEDRTQYYISLFGDTSGRYLYNFARKKVKIDNSYGIRLEENGMYIGDSLFGVKSDDIKLEDGSIYDGTAGLWELLTLQEPKNYTPEDLQAYEEIIFKTNNHMRYNDANSARLKCYTGYKYSNIIGPMFDRQNNIIAGSGLGLSKTSINRPVEYVYWNTVEELLDRLCILYGEIKSGNTNPLLRNEIVNIIQEFKEI